VLAVRFAPIVAGAAWLLSPFDRSVRASAPRARQYLAVFSQFVAPEAQVVPPRPPSFPAIRGEAAIDGSGSSLPQASA
jgi:hypothetical protein